MLISISCNGQFKRVPSYFGFQYRPLIPMSFVGDRNLELNAENFTSSISQNPGYTFGGTVRTGISDLIAIETGINFTKRNFDIAMSVPDSNLLVNDAFSFIEYDIPLNCLIYIKMAKEWFANASLGIAVRYKPSSIGRQINLQNAHTFIYTGYVQYKKKIGFDFNANIGFEYRTKNSGFFYLGGSVRVPFAPLFIIATQYKNEGNEITSYGDFNGSYLALDLKYFFPNKGGQGSSFKPGPIE